LITAYESWPSESAGSLTVRITSTYPFPRMLPDRALEVGKFWELRAEGLLNSSRCMPILLLVVVGTKVEEEPCRRKERN
jgi:hypothetical protein